MKPQSVRRKSSSIIVRAVKYSGTAKDAPEEGGTSVNTHINLRTKSMAIVQSIRKKNKKTWVSNK
jgi:hypothetical protein